MTINKKHNKYYLGAENTQIYDALCGLMIAFLPLLQHYKSPVRNAGFLVLVLLTPLISVRLLSRINVGGRYSRSLLAIMPLILYELYMIIDHGIVVDKTVFCLYFIFFHFAVAYGCVNFNYFFNSALFISKAGSIFIIVQAAIYYAFHFHLRMIAEGLLLEGSDMWISRARVVAATGGMYRASGFFLEPSHYLLYSFPLLATLLLDKSTDRKKIKDAAIISLGVIASTSGMGIAIVSFIWVLFWILYKNNTWNTSKLKRLLSIRTVIIIICSAALLIILYISIPLIRNTVLRIFNPETGQSQAISGRTAEANKFIKGLSGLERIFGVERIDVGIAEVNMPGFHATIYKWGIIGVLLSYWYYGQGILKLKDAYFIISSLILVLSFFSAHTHGTFYMIYYSMFLLNGYYYGHTSRWGESPRLAFTN